MSETLDPDFRDNPAASRFELTVEGHTAVIMYEPMPGGLVFVHTVVPKALEGKGVGGRLVKAALGEMRARGQKVRPDCTFVRGWLEKHPGFEDVVV
jgi:predicted GNAT family acetyltransferase